MSMHQAWSKQDTHFFRNPPGSRGLKEKRQPTASHKELPEVTWLQAASCSTGYAGLVLEEGVFSGG